MGSTVMMGPGKTARKKDGRVHALITPTWRRSTAMTGPGSLATLLNSPTCLFNHAQKGSL